MGRINGGILNDVYVCPWSENRSVNELILNVLNCEFGENECEWGNLNVNVNVLSDCCGLKNDLIWNVIWSLIETLNGV